MYNSKVDLTSATCSNLPSHGILLSFISMDRFNNVSSIAMFMTVNMIMHRDMYMIHIYVTQVKYTINDHTNFNIEVVALRGEPQQMCNSFLTVYLREYHSNIRNQLCRNNNGFVKQSTAGYPLRSQTFSD